eukprot:4121-Pelagomonas_calceolata.AAC.5
MRLCLNLQATAPPNHSRCCCCQPYAHTPHGREGFLLNDCKSGGSRSALLIVGLRMVHLYFANLMVPCIPCFIHRYKVVMHSSQVEIGAAMALQICAFCSCLLLSGGSTPTAHRGLQQQLCTGGS